ncbi:MAG TPA: FAD-binding oxidoreductase [Actinophytocola sp.]|uniref:FAD-binding oxidoreductase n=1 Tax=Actinophytocola sp. TaxID=1872138 RepID=UPI002DDD3DC9|nr:FAD-binding oxidoreductase [Actinophytocola sp.]HEV2780567.1 FAD-binding oxidoreductase [Actinophytocola sp.]
MITKSVFEASTTADVRAAVFAARHRGLPLAVYATGHGSQEPGDGAVVIRTAGMAGVLVDPDRRIARVGPGARWGDVISAAAPFGLAPLSGTSPSVGVTGYTLGGGLGWLSRRYGLAADSVVRADIVTADGSLHTVSADREPDLFWAIRGGGANFGVVTALEFRLYPVATVHAGVATFPLDRAADLLAYYRDWAPAMPDELTANIVLGKESVAVRGMYAGSAEDARCALAPLWRVAGTPLRDGWRTMGYTESGTIGGTAPKQFNLLAEVPDAVLSAAVEAVRGDANAVELRHWGGAMSRATADSGPAGHRDVPFSIVVDGPAEAAAPIAAHATGGSFLNFLHDSTRTRTAYTPDNYRRLREVKRAYDPDNVFGLTHNIPPAERPAGRVAS